ncbi:MAG TPA: fibronectin type III domain-containing protein [Chloroflexota bacterium]|nr:fibronectin type III domain-containing protein [Chloroflexota bacterium]
MGAAWWLRFLLTLGAVALVAGGVLSNPRVSDAMTEATFIRSVSWTNVTDTTFTVNWVTDFAVPGSGSIHYGTSRDNLSTTVSESVVAGAPGDVHSVNVSGLEPNTTYYFEIHDASLIASNNGNLYSVTTGKTLTTQPPIYYLSGTVTQTDGKTGVVGALVTVRIADYANLNGNLGSTSAPLSTQSGAGGNWQIFLDPRTQDGSAFFQFNPNGGDSLVVTIEAGQQGNGGTRTIPLAIDSNGRAIAGSMPVALGTVPTDTPVPNGGTVVPTATVTPTTAPPTPTNTPRPASTPQITGVPTATTAPSATATTQISVTAIPTPSTPAPTANPQANLLAEPTKMPIPLQVVSPTQPNPASPTPTELRQSPPRAQLVPPSVGATTGAPTMAPLRASPPPDFRSLPTATATPSRVGAANVVTITAVPLVVTPAMNSPGEASAQSPLSQIVALLAGAFGLLGLGLVMLVFGVVGQMRRD